MSYTKQQLIDDAFEEIGIASYDYDVSPEEYQSALRKLDRMMGTWASKGISVSYPIPASPENSNLNQESNVPNTMVEGLVANLAKRLAPSFGKTLSQETKDLAKDTYENLARLKSEPAEIPLNTTVYGAGNRQIAFTNNVFINPTNEGF